MEERYEKLLQWRRDYGCLKTATFDEVYDLIEYLVRLHEEDTEEITRLTQLCRQRPKLEPGYYYVVREDGTVVKKKIAPIRYKSRSGKFFVGDVPGVDEESGENPAKSIHAPELPTS